MAVEADVNRNTVARMENGIGVYPKSARRVAAALDVPLAHILAETQADVNDTGGRTPRDRALEFLRDADDELRAEARAVLMKADGEPMEVSSDDAGRRVSGE